MSMQHPESHSTSFSRPAEAVGVISPTTDITGASLQPSVNALAFVGLIILVVLLCVSGVYHGRRLAVAAHQGNKKQLANSAIIQAYLTVLLATYAYLFVDVFAALLLAFASLLSFCISMLFLQKNPNKDLDSSSVRTDAILEEG